jgi:uncharacterized membrane protein
VIEKMVEVNSLINAVIGVVIGLALLPVLTSSINSAKENATGIVGVLLDIIPVLYVIVLVVGLVWYLKSKGGE